MPVPFKDGGKELGEVIIRIDVQDRISLLKNSLMTVASSALTRETLESLRSLPGNGGFVTLEELRAAGLIVEFDASRLEARLGTMVDQRPEGEISLKRRLPRQASEVAARPAVFSAYLNAIAGIDYRWGGYYADEAASARLELQPVFRLYGVVVEGDFHYDGEVDPGICPLGAICNYGHIADLKRRRTRLVYDLPAYQLRFQAGDTNVLGTALQRTTDVLGVSLEKSPRKLQPGESIRPTGRTSFRLDRPSEVEVLVNGAIVQKFTLRPGNYNLTDLPLATGGNNVELRITDDVGMSRSLAFSTFYDATLLAAGMNEWAVAMGLPSYLRDYEVQYRGNDYLATGFYRQGVTDKVTAELHLQADRHVVMGGAGVFAMTPWALVGLEAALSDSDSGVGGQASVVLERTNALGPFSYWTGNKESLRLGAEIRSSAYRIPGEFIETATGIIYPRYPYWLKLHGTYSVPIGFGVAASLSARYQFSDDEALAFSPWTFRGDRYGVDLTLAAPLGFNTTGSLTIGYSNEYLYWNSSRWNLPSDELDGDFRIMARIYMRPSADTSISASYDTLIGGGQINARQERGRGVDRWETSVDVNAQGLDAATVAGASAAYWGNRFDARVSAAHITDGRKLRNANFDGGTNLATVRVGTALVYADGAVAIGPPVKGQGFAIIDRHKSLADNTVFAGTQDHVYARADAFGPGVVVDLPAYSPRTVPIDVEDLPLGYAIGQGAFETSAPYRGGYRIVVGSDYAITVYGTMLQHNGEPLSLVSGTAFQQEALEKRVAVFTNRVGRFGADGLKAGRWTLEMESETGTVRYVIDVPEGADKLHQTGSIRPIAAGGQP